MVRALPPVLTLRPCRILVRELNLANTRTSVVLLSTVVGLPVATWTVMTYFDANLPDREEAAQVDDSSRTRSFSRIVLWLSTRAPATAPIFYPLLVQ